MRQMKSWQIAIVLVAILAITIGGTVVFEKVRSRIVKLGGQVMLLETTVQDLQQKATLYTVGIQALPWAEVEVFTQKGENLLKKGEVTPTCVRRVSGGEKLKLVFSFSYPSDITIVRTVVVREGRLIGPAEGTSSVAVAAWKE